MQATVRNEAFLKFYTAHLDKVYRFVFFRVGGNKQLAEDLVSEIFIKALEHFDRYDERKSRSAWIMTIAKNHLANHWRDTKPADRLPGEDGEGFDDAFWLHSALKNFRKNMAQHEVNDLVKTLDKTSRTIVTFHYLVGYSYAEIAEMLEMSETAVKVAAHRALKKLSKVG